MSMTCQVLPPREAAKFIADHSQDVTIDAQGVEDAAAKIFELMKDNPGLVDVERWKLHQLNPKSADELALEWVFVSAVVNFSFWSEDETKRFMVRYGGKEWTGYWSFCAAMNRALDEGIPFTSAAYFCTISLDQLKYVLRSDSATEMPLLRERQTVLHEAGKVLIEKYEGSFANMVSRCGKSAQRLLEMIVADIPSFRDTAVFHNQQVAVYKRAQILIADSWGACGGKGLAEFTDIDSITMFADYRIPQALVWFGVMKYSDPLTEQLTKRAVYDSGMLAVMTDHMWQSGEREEVEIRGCSIWAVELLVEETKRLVAADSTLCHQVVVNALTMDHFLWDYRQQHAEETRNVPFHKIRCIYY